MALMRVKIKNLFQINEKFVKNKKDCFRHLTVYTLTQLHDRAHVKLNSAARAGEKEWQTIRENTLKLKLKGSKTNKTKVAASK
jgi:hypothetical protein